MPPPPSSRALEVPDIDVGALNLEQRGRQQIEALAASKVRHDFHFVDRRVESGITFRHQSTEDSTRRYKMVHYDHGNSVSVADVDGDHHPDLYFVSQLGSNELWRNLGNGRFENITERAGVGMGDRVSVAASFADIDNDGDRDLFVTTVRMGNVLFVNDGTGRFRDATKSAGLEHVGHSSGAVFFDFDRDGLLDLFVTNIGRYTEDRKGPGNYYLGLEDAFQGHLQPERTETSLLYRNLGNGKFEEVSAAMGLVDGGWTGDATFADLNRDGFPDLYVLNMQGDDRYYENVGGKSFVERTASYFPRTPWGSMGVKFFDYDNDGYEDLLLTDMHSDMSMEVDPPGERAKSIMMWDEKHLQGGDNNVFGNALYHGGPKGPFDEVSDRLGAENYWPWGLSTGDLNADGFEDVFIASSMSYPFRYGVNTVLLNASGESFVHSEFALGVEPRAGGKTKAPVFEIDCSSPEDRAWPRHDRICQQRRGTYTVMGNLGTRASAILDYDGDGDLDIVTGEFNAEPQVLTSDLAQRHPIGYLAVRLVGTSSNRDGLGATVEVRTEKGAYRKLHDGKTGYLAQGALPLYFGLDGSQAASVTVTWPSGRSQQVDENLPHNDTIEIVESRAP